MPREMSGAVSGVIPRAGPRAGPRAVSSAAGAALRAHWPAYLIEAAGLGAFMIAAGLCVMLISAPPVARAGQNPDLRRALIGAAMGLDSDRADLFAMGDALGRASEPGGDAELLAPGQGRP